LRENCDCQYCKHKVNEKFCIDCLRGYNDCESHFELIDLPIGDLPIFGIPLCPHCLPENWEMNKQPLFIKKRTIVKKGKDAPKQKESHEAHETALSE
jgi:hypothetical protein